MARQIRVKYPGAIYHVSCRMIGGRQLEQSRLFIDDKDRTRFVDRLADRVKQFNVRLYQFVLMTNHFHLVVETPEGNCPQFMQSLSTAYTVYYNLRHDRHGHLLDGRYKAKLVDGDDYLQRLTRYVHLNPIHVGGIKDKLVPEKIKYLLAYPWSSYRSYIGKDKELDFVAYEPVLSMMGGKKSHWCRRYQEFVETGLAGDDSEFQDVMKMSPRSIGGDSFRGWVDDFYQKLIEGHNKIEDVSFRHTTEPLKTEDVLSIMSSVLGVPVAAFKERRRNSALRALAAQLLVRFGGLTQRQVSDVLQMGTGGAVSAQIRRLPGLLAEDRQLGQTFKKMEIFLEGIRSKHDVS
ncbi:MAG: transposase [Kiritimatiellae bacterium]|nr:transposase [Kiritimatiellia bacterium]